MALEYTDRPFYSWPAESPDIQVELQVVMEKLSDSTGHRKRTVTFEMTNDNVPRSRKRFHVGRFVTLFLLSVGAMLVICCTYVSGRVSDLIQSSRIRTLTEDMETLITNLKTEREACFLHRAQQTIYSEMAVHKAFVQTNLHVASPGGWLEDVRPQIEAFRRTFRAENMSATKQLSSYSRAVSKMAAKWIQTYPQTNGLSFWKSLARYQNNLLVNFRFYLENDIIRSLHQTNNDTTDVDIFLRGALNSLLYIWRSTVTQPEQNMSAVNTSLPDELINSRMNGIMFPSNGWLKTVKRFKRLQQNSTRKTRQRFMNTVTQLQNKDRNVITMYMVMVFISLSFCPVLIWSIRSILLFYNQFTKALNTRLQQLQAQENRKKSVMCQFMPPPIANSLTQKGEINTELFSSATILFADIHGLSSLIAKHSPVDVVSIANCLFTLLDERIEKYDAYRMDIVGESYMISSGVPRRNGNKHVTEIANLALDLVNVFSDLEVIYSPDYRVSFKLGIHTGPCVAALFGSAMPRYRLIGETVGIASRMESTSLPNKIQISSASQAMLACEDYLIQPRGVLEIGGKRRIVTHWLIGRTIEEDPALTDQCEMDNSRRRESFSAWSTIALSETRRSSEGTGSRMSFKVTTTRISFEDRAMSTFHRPNRAFTEKFPTVEDMEILQANKSGSPLILQLTEGVHY